MRAKFLASLMYANTVNREEDKFIFRYPIPIYSWFETMHNPRSFPVHTRPDKRAHDRQTDIHNSRPTQGL